jgi:tetratricopeptide (TPR) repeat protein
MSKRTRSSFEEAENLLRQAIRIIGPNPLLISSLGHTFVSYNLLGISPDPVYIDKAEECLKQVTDLAPDSQHTYLLRGLIRYKQGRIQEAIDALKVVLENDPNNKDGLMFLSLQYLISGYAHYAKPLLDRLVSIDPLEPTTQLMPGYVRFILGDFEGAIPYYKKALDMAPENPFIALLFCQIASRVLPADQLIPILEQVEPLAEFHTFGRQARFLKHALQGQVQEAIAAGADARLQNESRFDEHPSWWMTCVYAIIDQKESALEWLENTIERGFINYPLMAYLDPAMQNLRSEDKFWELMQVASDRWEAINP